MTDQPANIISLLLPLLIILGILIMCGWIVKRRFIDKKWPSPGTQFVTRVIYSQYETQEHIKATREMNFAEEDEKDEDRGGEKPRSGEKRDKPDDRGNK